MTETVLDAAELHRRGVEAVNEGKARKAGKLLTRAWELTDDAGLRATIEVSRAYVAMELGDPVEAARLCSAALEGGALDAPGRGVALCQLAMVRMRHGEAPAALELFDEGISLLGDEPAHLAKALGNRGDVYLHQGRLGNAIGDLSGAAALFAATGQPIEQAKAKHNLGYARLLAGDLVEALRDMEAAAPVLAPLSPVMRAIGEQDRAEALLAAGLHREGVTLLRAAAAGYGERKLRQRQAEAELALARSTLVRSPSLAMEAAEGARRRFEKLGAVAWRARADVVALAAEVELGRSDRAVAQRGDDLVRELEQQGLHWAAEGAALQVVRILMRLGELRAARDRLDDVALEGRAPLTVRLLASEVRAELAARMGDGSAALAHLRQGISDMHAWQSSFGSLDLQTNVVGHGTRLAVGGLALAVASEASDVLFEWSERARMLASRIQPVRAPQDEQTVAQLTELRGDPSPEREAELRQQIRERAWQRKGSGEVVDPVPLADLQQELGADTALVAHVVTADRVVALVVTSDATTRHDLGDRADLDALVGGLLPDLDMASSNLPGPMAGVVLGELAERLGNLARVLIAPLVQDLGERSVVLTPSGVLAGVPWTLLPGLVGRPVTVAQSATSWLTRRATPLRAESAGLVAGPRVARAEAEVSAAAAAWSGAKTLTGEAATAGAVSELACQVDVLHLAAHGKHSSENPLFSGVQLADGAWFGYDIDQLSAVPDVVILSACEVGRSSVRAGEELIGMTAAWLHAGARCVIASAASVSDDVAHDVLTKVHAQLAQGIAPDIALAEAVPAVDAERPPAPFVCFG